MTSITSKITQTGNRTASHWGAFRRFFWEQSKTDFESLVNPLFNGHAFQIGVGLSKAMTSVSFIGTLDHASHLHLNKNILESAELVKEVDKVLDTKP